MFGLPLGCTRYFNVRILPPTLSWHRRAANDDASHRIMRLGRRVEIDLMVFDTSEGPARTNMQNILEIDDNMQRTEPLSLKVSDFE